MKKTRTWTALALALLLTASCTAAPQEESEQPTPSVQAEDTATDILLSDSGITVDGQAIPEDSTAAVWLGHDIIYYEDRDAYDSGNPYGEGTEADRHTAQEASAHAVVHITQPGTYRLTGTLSQGQVAVDLGENAKTDPDAVVTLILDGLDLTCTVAPAIIFYRVYECDTAWTAYDEGEADSYEASPQQDTAAAGANILLADGTVNRVSGSYVARIYKDGDGQKKLYKFDGALYSKMSMNVDGGETGDGVLELTAENEGLDSELHLTINGGTIRIQAQNDGINTNEDGVSVTTVNGGSLHILAGLGEEGDGIDSNGYLVINGGVVIALANPASDSGLDSDLGSYINGGYVLATGSTMDWPESDCAQVTMNLQFAAAQEADQSIIVADPEGSVVFAYDPNEDETAEGSLRAYQGAILSCPELTLGETYEVYVGGQVDGQETDGLYDVSTVTGFTGGTRQKYTGSDVGMAPGGGFDGRFDGGMEPPDGMTDDRESPEGMEPPEDGNRPGGPDLPDGEIPDGDLPDGEMPGGEMPDGKKPDGAFPGGEPFSPEGGRPDGDGRPDDTQTEGSTLFTMTDQVNSFSGVQPE